MKQIIRIFVIVLLTSQASFAQKTDSLSRYSLLGIRPKTMVTPLVLATAGIYIQSNYALKADAQTALRAALPFTTKIDDYLVFAPILPVYAHSLLTQKSANYMLNQTLLLAKTELLVLGTVYLLKNTTKVLRPDGSARNSFPSGHTAQAFASATFLRHELGDKNIWIAIGGYAVATSAGLMRIANNRHWLSDVCLGAAIGILGTELVYATHKNKYFTKKKFGVMPVVGYKQAGLLVRF